jgi:membrane protein implicated in regulation of membrane protease activity
MKVVREDQIDRIEMEKFEHDYNVKALRVWYGINLIAAGIYMFIIAFAIIYNISLLFWIPTAVALVFFAASFLFRYLSTSFKGGRSHGSDRGHKTEKE